RPIFDEASRLHMVEQLKPVDRAILGHEGDMFVTVMENRPDIITLGYDQRFRESEIEAKCREMGLDTRVVRISGYDRSPYKSSSDIRNRIIQIIEGSL
ncbi:MAG: FAD synthase, partial [Thermoplasmataceae archaeon]